MPENRKPGRLTIPDSTDVARELPSDILYKLELAGEIAREVLDERIVEWTEAGKSQRWIATELDCDQRTVGRRQERLGVKSKAPRAGNQTGRRPTEAARLSEPVPVEHTTEDDGEEVWGEIVADGQPQSPHFHAPLVRMAPRQTRRLTRDEILGDSTGAAVAERQRRMFEGAGSLRAAIGTYRGKQIPVGFAAAIVYPERVDAWRQGIRDSIAYLRGLETALDEWAN
jgi:hypothetical protein